MKHASAAKIINLNRVEEWVIEADTRSTVDDDVDLGLQHLTILLAQAELVDNEVAAHRDDFLAQLLHQARFLLKQRCEDLRFEHLSLQALLKSHVFLRPNHHKYLSECGHCSDNFLKHDLADETCGASDQNCLVRVEFPNA